VLEIIF